MALQISLPREYSKDLRVGQWLKVESVGEVVVLSAVDDAPRYAEPEIFVGSNWEGLSFEVPPDQAYGFLTVLARELNPTRIVLYYSENGEEQMLEVSERNLADAIAQVGDRVLDHTFSADFDEHTLFSGGEGCFSLQAALPTAKLREVAQAVLDLLDVDHQLNRDDFQIGVINGETEVYR